MTVRKSEFTFGQRILRKQMPLGRKTVGKSQIITMVDMLTSEGVELDIIKRKVYLNVVEGDLCFE